MKVKHLLHQGGFGVGKSTKFNIERLAHSCLRKKRKPCHTQQGTLEAEAEAEGRASTTSTLGPIGTSNALRVAEPDDHHIDIDNAFFDTSLSEVVTSLDLTNTNVDNPKGHESSKKTK